MAVQVTCKQCGESFSCQPSQAKGGRTYCSRACFYKGQSEESGITLNCENCATQFKCYPYQKADRKYCSKECSGKGRRKQSHLTCAFCSELFLAYPSQISNGRKYCSKECSGEGRREDSKSRVTCAHCEQEFSLPLSKAKTRKYCSLECASNSKKIRVTLICPGCDTEFSVKKSRASRTVHCSRKCDKSTPSKGLVSTHCQYCNSEFQISESRFKHGRGKHCSKECQYESNKEKLKSSDRVVLSCHNCSGVFEKALSAIANTKGAGKYCSRVCRDEHRKGENHPQYIHGSNADFYGPNWQAQRRAARKRDKRTCQSCGTKNGPFDVHHIVPRRHFDDLEEANKLDNLVTLCKPCHRSVEAEIQAKERMG